MLLCGDCAGKAVSLAHAIFQFPMKQSERIGHHAASATHNRRFDPWHYHRSATVWSSRFHT